MPKSENQKLKLLYLRQIFEQETNEENPLTLRQLEEALTHFNIQVERKTLLADIEALQQFGMDIVTLRSQRNSYYLGQRSFEMPELKLLVDAVQSAKFITAKKSEALITKIAALSSRRDARLLRRQVHVQGRVKAENEGVYYTVDALHTAMGENNQVSFLYFGWTINKSGPTRIEKKLRHNGERYTISPWALVWDDEFYYLLGYDQQAQIIKHYRVDKMDSLQLVKQDRAGKEVFEKLDMVEYAKRTFGMFGGDSEPVKLRFANRLAGVVADRFGRDISVYAHDDGWFEVSVQAIPSPQFLAWVLGFGNEVEVLQPPAVVQTVLQTLAEVGQVYNQKI